MLHLRYETNTEYQNVSSVLLNIFKQYVHMLFHKLHSVSCIVHIYQVTI
jgi:hypothetical protein